MRRTISRGVRLLAFLAIAAGIGSTGASAEAAQFSINVNSDTTAGWSAGIDLNPGFVRVGPTLYAMYSTGLREWRRYSGTDIDSLSTSYSVATRDSTFTQSHGDDQYWIGGIYPQASTGDWYATIHREFNYSRDGVYPRLQRTLGLAKSTDQGLNWTYLGDITSGSSAPAPHSGDINFGTGDHKLVVDSTSGYFYLYYLTGWYNTASSGRQSEFMGVARCPISSLMAPGCWKKFYRGSFSEDGLGGKETAPATGATVALSVHYNTYLSKWVMVDNQGIWTATDLSTQNWSPLDQAFPGGRLESYQWVVDATNKYDTQTAGQTFRVYHANYPNAARYFTVTLGSGTSSPPNVLNNSDYESGSSGWTSWGGTNSSAPGRNGTGVALRTAASGGGGWSQPIPSWFATNYPGQRTGRTYRVSGWVKATAGSTAYFGVKTTVDGVDQYCNVSSTATSWTLIQRACWIPGNSSVTYFYNWVDGNGQADFDDADLRNTNPNLVANSSFERGLGGWTDWGGTNGLTDLGNADLAYLGPTALKVQPTGGQAQQLSGWTSGQTYTVSGWGKLAVTGNTGYIGIKLVPSGGGSPTYINAPVTSTDWSYVSTSFIVPAGTAEVWVYSWVDSGGGTLYADELNVS